MEAISNDSISKVRPSNVEQTMTAHLTTVSGERIALTICEDEAISLYRALMQRFDPSLAKDRFQPVSCDGKGGFVVGK